MTSLIRMDAKVYHAQALRKLKVYEKALRRTGQATVQELVNMGKLKAKSIVPKGTGWLGSTIRGQVERMGDDTRGKIYLDPYITPLSQRTWGAGNYPKFSLARWMHETGGKFQTPNPAGTVGQQHITSGDPYFMYTTRDYLNSKKKGIAKGKFKNINISGGI